ncbi:MAG: mechanosensitive ion channel family protein [Acidimicrobiia bacterium]
MLQQLEPPVELIDACGTDPSWACRRVFDATDNDFVAGLVDFVVGAPLRVVLVVVVAAVVSRLVRRAARRFADELAGVSGTRSLGRGVLLGGLPGPRATARAETIGSVLASTATAIVWATAAVTVLGELGVNLGPIIASAGIAGVALGFGAQSLVKDFLSGVFMLAEDQYGVGDIVDVGEAVGTVEGVSLRTTRIRDVNGTMWHVPNGQIVRVGNKSQEWARALLDVSVGYDTDLRHAERVIKRVADAMWHDPDWDHRLLEEPEVWGVENLGVDGVDIRLVIKTQPAEQFTVMRELRMRLKEAFDADGIEMPFPQRTVWVRRQEDAFRADGAGTEAGGALPEAGPTAPGAPSGP